MSDQDTEPSIEEILKSIRQIISDDDDQDENVEDIVEDSVEKESVAEPEPPPPEPEAVEEDVIDLVEKVEEPVEVEPEPEPVEDNIVEEEPEPPVEVEEPEPEPEIPSEPEVIEPSEPINMDDGTSDILTAAAETAALDAFAVLAKKSAIEANGITVEEIVRTELRPLLKTWLDGHLPTIIERLVQEELERVAKRAFEE